MTALYIGHLWIVLHDLDMHVIRTTYQQHVYAMIPKACLEGADMHLAASSLWSFYEESIAPTLPASCDRRCDSPVSENCLFSI